MTVPLTVQGELRLPAAVLQGQPPSEVERRLQGYGLVPAQASERRWRIDTDTPGGYVLTYTYVLSPAPEPEPGPEPE